MSGQWCCHLLCRVVIDNTTCRTLVILGQILISLMQVFSSNLMELLLIYSRVSGISIRTLEDKAESVSAIPNVCSKCSQQNIEPYIKPLGLASRSLVQELLKSHRPLELI